MKFGAGDVIDYILMWLGISILMHAFPSRGDAKALLTAVKDTEGNLLLKTVCYPIIILINLGAFGSIFWLDLIYGFAVAALLPDFIIQLFIKLS